MYEFIIRGEYPIWTDTEKSLVQHGLAQFIVENSTYNDPNPVIQEPLALVGIMRYFESREYTVAAHIEAGLKFNKGNGFENLILVAITRLLRGGDHRLKDIFQFHGEPPEWAHETAQIVVQTTSGSYSPFDIIVQEPMLPSSAHTVEAEKPGDVQRWLQHGGAGWCIPGRYMGPDLMTWVRLHTGKILLLVVQAKCHLTGNITSSAASLPADVTADAIRSLTPDEFFQSLVCEWFSPSSLASFSLHLAQKQSDPEAETGPDSCDARRD